jgi:hypothetical protein
MTASEREQRNTGGHIPLTRLVITIDAALDPEATHALIAINP